MALKEYAQSNGYDLIRIFNNEGISGGLEDRPGLAELFSFLESADKIDGVLIYKLDRLARDLYIQEHLIKKLEILNTSIISTKEHDLDSNDPMRKAFRQFMGIVAELEKAFITMRLSGGRINKARKGKYAGGGIPLGYRTENKDIKLDDEASILIKQIFKMRKVNKMSLRKIAESLNDRKIPTVRGGKWHASTIEYILRNQIYKGNLSYKSIDFKQHDLSII